jgi:hypothetical protein
MAELQRNTARELQELERLDNRVDVVIGKVDVVPRPRGKYLGALEVYGVLDASGLLDLPLAGFG